MNGKLPGKENWGFNDEISRKTAWEGSMSMEFSEWQIMESDPLEAGSLAAVLVTELQARKVLGPLLDLAQLEEGRWWYFS